MNITKIENTSSELSILFLILSHNLPDQLTRLVKTLVNNSEACQVLVLHEFSKCSFDQTELQSIPRVHILNAPNNAEWGDFSIVANMLYGTQWAEENLSFDWMVLISGQDYPIKSLTYMEQRFATTEYDGYIQKYYADQPNPLFQDQTYSRYYFRYFSIPKFPYYYRIPKPIQKLLRAIRVGFKHKIPIFRLKGGYRGTNLRLGIRWPSYFSKNFRCYVGRQWFSINIKSVKYLNKFVHENPQFIDFYHRCLIPDESFVHTVLHNNPDLSLANDSLVYVKFIDKINAASPQILTMEDFQNLLENDAHFARKFDLGVDSEIFDKLDADVIDV